MKRASRALQRGSAVVLFLPVVLGLIAATWLILDAGRAAYASEKAAVVADATLLSALRVRAEGLQKIADRWNEVGRWFGAADADGIDVGAAEWSAVQSSAAELMGAVPGYKGRIKAVLKPVAEANGIAAAAMTLTQAGALNLGISPQAQWIRDESGRRFLLRGAWYKRDWASNDRWGQPDEDGRQEARLSFAVLNAGSGRWTAARQENARLRWDVDLLNDGVATVGNGGFPRTWNEALNDGRVDPCRFAVFRADPEGT